MYDDVTLIFDIDGTICPIKDKNEAYEDVVPSKDMLEKIRHYKANGCRIVLFTSRNVNTYKGNIGQINANTLKVLFAWLDKWDIPYDEIIANKPWPGKVGFYIDDRTVRPDEFLNHSLEELQQICDNSRIK